MAKLFCAAVFIRLSREDGDKEESDRVGNQRKLLSEYVSKIKDLFIAAHTKYQGKERIAILMQTKHSRCAYIIRHMEGMIQEKSVLTKQRKKKLT